MTTCINCDGEFRRKTGGYYRYSLERIVESSGLAAREHLEQLTGATLTSEKGQFLCPQCWNKLNETVRFRKSLDAFFACTSLTSSVGRKRSSAEPGTSGFLKRPRFSSTPKKTSIHRGRSATSGKWETIITAIRARQYGRAISGLYYATKGSQRRFVEFITRTIRKEIKALINLGNDFNLCRDVNIPNIAEFSWDDTIANATASAPLLLGCLRGAVTTSRNETSMMKGSTNQVSLKPRIGTALSLLLHSKAPRKTTFLPTLLSVQFWRGGLKRETIKQVSRLGICVSYEATLSAIDRIRADFDSAALKCQFDMENSLKNRKDVIAFHEKDNELNAALSVSAPNLDDEIVDYPELEDTILYSDAGLTLSSSIKVSPGINSSSISDSAENDIDDDSVLDLQELEVDKEDISVEEEADMIVQCEWDPSSGEENILQGFHEELGGDTSFTAKDDTMTVRSECRGFTMCWDNVGKKVISRFPTETKKNRYLNMALGYIAVNRIHTLNFEWREDNLTNAADIPIENFIPQQQDFEQLRYRMTVLVGRIISKHLTWFHEYFSQFTTPHIIHEYSTESTRKSIFINLGVFQEDPCSTEGAIAIYEKLQKYVPIVDSKPVKTVVFGDGLSCERGNDAQRARSNGLTPLERLEGLEPAAQEFHKEMLLLQDFYDTFYKGSSASNRGTICQIRNILNFRQVKSDISDNFSHAWELMCTVVESFICLLVMSNLDLEDVNSRPVNVPENIETASPDDKSDFFENICTSVVDQIWQQLDTSSRSELQCDGPPDFCCGEDLDEDMIGCEARSSCSQGEFFHYSCAGVDPENPVVPWYCSRECRRRQIAPYQYCVCRQDLGRNVPMIGCSRESLCLNREWYHMTCIGVNPENPPKGKWFCSDKCRQQTKSRKKSKTKHVDKPDKDLKEKYSLSLIWAGLNLLSRRDAVREADGNAMISFWRLDLIHFFGNKHPKYTILAHRLIAAISGWMPEKVKFDLIHNRTVNYSGGIGRNLPLDFMNEIFNRLFKDLLESAKGRYTDTTLQRCSQIIGPLGETLDTVFDSNIVEHEIYRHRRRAQNRDINVSA